MHLLGDFECRGLSAGCALARMQTTGWTRHLLKFGPAFAGDPCGDGPRVSRISQHPTVVGTFHHLYLLAAGHATGVMQGHRWPVVATGALSIATSDTPVTQDRLSCAAPGYGCICTKHAVVLLRVLGGLVSTLIVVYVTCFSTCFSTSFSTCQ